MQLKVVSAGVPCDEFEVRQLKAGHQHRLRFWRPTEVNSLWFPSSRLKRKSPRKDACSACMFRYDLKHYGSEPWLVSTDIVRQLSHRFQQFILSGSTLLLLVTGWVT